MITCRQLLDEGFVEIAFASESGTLYGARLTYSTDGGATYHPCAIYLDRGPDRLLASGFWEWNEAVQFGNVKFNGAPHTLYWNTFLNGVHAAPATVIVRVEALREHGIEADECTLALQTTRARYWHAWQEGVAEGSGWRVESGALTVEPGREVAPFVVRPGLQGRYRVILGVPSGALHLWLRLRDEETRHPLIASQDRAAFAAKAHKEIAWRTVELQPEAALEIRPIPTAIRHSELYPPGRIAYLKFVPEPPSTPRAAVRWADKKLALYFEPYSWAFIYGLDSVGAVREALSLYQEMGADEVHTQAIRFGSRALHHSRVAEHFSGTTAGDDGTHSTGPEQMVRALDVLRVTIDLCHEMGMTHYANAGLTNCYPGTSLEDKISREHPEWRTGNILRYGFPETRAYAAAIVQEFIAWGTDGVTIDCMRYPYHHTEEELLLLFHEIRRAMDVASPHRPIPLTVRIPAGDAVYYRVFQRLAQEGVIQCVIPSTIWERLPLFSLRPYLKWRDYGCRVYGRIDGWEQSLWGNHHLLLHPLDIRADITRFLKEGADGIYVYQGDQHAGDAFTRDVLDWRKWGE